MAPEAVAFRGKVITGQFQRRASGGLLWWRFAPSSAAFRLETEENGVGVSCWPVARYTFHLARRQPVLAVGLKSLGGGKTGV
jgi:hypothetical protein